MENVTVKSKFVISGYSAFSEKDSFANGCIGNAMYESASGRDWSVSANSFAELIEQLRSEFRADSMDCFLPDSCDEPGRLDVQVMQRKPFMKSKSSAATIEDWKAGKLDLWLTCYTFHVKRTLEEFPLIDLFNAQMKGGK